MTALRILLGLFVSTIVLLLPTGSAAQVTTGNELTAHIDALLRTHVQRGDFGGTVLVARNDSVMYEHSFGLASVEFHVPNANSTRYRIHSITKQFTAMAVLVLSQRHQLDVKASVRNYLPELPASWKDATVEEVLTHTSGIPLDEAKWFDAYRNNDVHNELDNLKIVAPLVMNDTLVTRPGATFAYNNFGYDLLGCVVERVSGMPLAAFIAQNVFAPAHMTDAGFDRRMDIGSGTYVASAIVPRLAYGYNGPPARLQVATPLMWGSAGAGGMYATARDLFNYDRALNRALIVPAAAETVAVTGGFRISDKGSYGYGWIVRHVSDGAYFVHHSGGNNGYVADYARYPREHICIIVLSNLGSADPEGIREAIGELFFGKKYTT